MSTHQRLLDLLPPPYAVDPTSVLARLLDVAALELDVLGEDLDRVRRTHWVDLVYHPRDLDKLAALVGVERLSWESLPAFRSRLLALVKAQLAGAVGVKALRGFVYDYLARSSEALDATLVPGLGRFDAEGAFAEHPEAPAYRPLSLVENPPRLRRSNALRARRGRVPYLFRWSERNRGLADTAVACTVTGATGGRTAVPIIANVTTGDLVGYAGVLGVGERLRIEPVVREHVREARATLTSLAGEHDVTSDVFSVDGFRMGVPFTPGDLDPVPLVPRLARGANDWVYLSAGLLGTEGLDHVFFAIAGEDLREGVFDQTSFDRSVFPSGTVAGLELDWVELEPASFEIGVPRFLTVAPEGSGAVHEELAAALTAGIDQLHAAGVRARIRFEPSTETQPQRETVRLPWITLPTETGPVGTAELSLGARFGESAFATTKFE